jgi:hypothetical protein
MAISQSQNNPARRLATCPEASLPLKTTQYQLAAAIPFRL